MKISKFHKILLFIILVFAFSLRIYKLQLVPPSLSWDEAAVGYNSWTISEFTKDEYGKFLPLYFQSFGEDKQPIHIYITAVFVKLLGLSEFSTRLPIALFGTMNVFLIFLLAVVLFKNETVGLIAALFFSISPYNIFFSRFNHESNIALFFFMLGVILFYLSLKKFALLVLSILCFLISMISYHAAEIVVPPLVFLLLVFHYKLLYQNKKGLFLSTGLLLIFILMTVFYPRLFGTARFNQTIQGQAAIEKTWIYQQTKSPQLGRISLILEQYSWTFTPSFLFISGDKNPRLSVQGMGEFYKIDALLIILGIIYLIIKRSKESFFLLTWLLVSPLPSSIVAEAPHAGRASFIMGSWHLITAFGLYYIINLFRKSFLKWIIVFITIISLTFSLFVFLNIYFNEFNKKYAVDWQYGMKQIVEYVQQHQEYNSVFVTDVRSEPYIFFLYYLQVPLPEYLDTVIYNNRIENRSYNNVASFGRFSFGGWDPIESIPIPGVLYIVSSSQYDGLRYKAKFDIKKVIYFPNNTVAFYLVSSSL